MRPLPILFVVAVLAACSAHVALAPTDGSTTTLSVPGAPTNVAATAGDSRATISFSPPASTGGAPITQYLASCSAGGGAEPNASPGVSSPIVVGGLTNGTTYSCNVAANNVLGTGPVSASVSVTPRIGARAAIASQQTP